MITPPPLAPPHPETHLHRLQGVPRWPALIAVALITLAFVFVPEELSVGPRWLVPSLVAFFSAVTLVARSRVSARATHRIALVVNGSICATVVLSAVTLVTEGLFGGVEDSTLSYEIALDHGEVECLVGMTPSARHLTTEARATIARLVGIRTRASFRVLAFRPNP